MVEAKTSPSSIIILRQTGVVWLVKVCLLKGNESTGGHRKEAAMWWRLLCNVCQ